MLQKIQAYKEDLAEQKRIKYRFIYDDNGTITEISEPEFERRLYEGENFTQRIWDLQERVILGSDAIEEYRKQVIEEAKDE